MVFGAQRNLGVLRESTVTGSIGGIDPTGTVSFYACGENVDPCVPSGTPFDTETLSGTSNPAMVTSASSTPDSTGTWCFAAVYSGDGNYAPATVALPSAQNVVGAPSKQLLTSTSNHSDSLCAAERRQPRATT